MAEGSASEGSSKGEAGFKMDAGEVPAAKDHGFGDIVTLNVGGKRWGDADILYLSSSLSCVHVCHVFSLQKHSVCVQSTPLPCSTFHICANKKLSCGGSFLLCVTYVSRFSTSRQTLSWVPDSFFSRLARPREHSSGLLVCR